MNGARGGIGAPASAGREAAPRALVVDDHAPLASALARWLERDGIPCDTAGSELEAARLCRTRAYDLVLADVQLPGGSGLDLARMIKAQDPAIQVIIMTGSTSLETAVAALRLDADDYLVKPFDASAVLHAVRRAVDHRRLLLENREFRLRLEERVQEQARRLEGLYLSSIQSLARALEAKDPHTRGHSDRVTAYALALERRVGGVSRDSLRIGAQLHDIGKIGITSRILWKDGPLSADEMDIVRRHPSIGVEILTPLLDDREALAVVRYHHERWDGGGYPAGLAGHAIPRAARIVAVADAFDAMTTSRPYRGSRTSAQAIAELEAEAGIQFDADVVRAASEIFLGGALLVP